MRRFLVAVAALLISATASHAAIMWTGTFTPSTNGGSGSIVDLTGRAFNPAFTLTGSNFGSLGSVVTTYTADAPPAPPPFWLVEFDWVYSTEDTCGSWMDPFGYIIDGVQTQLSTDAPAPAFQSGMTSFVVAAGSNFGWYIDATDDQFGPAEVDVFATITAVPVPAAGFLLFGALGALGIAARRRTAV